LTHRREFFSIGAGIDLGMAHPGQASGNDRQKLHEARTELIGEQRPEGGVLSEMAAQIRKELGYKD
jgi:hypothetical protein